MQPKAPQIGFDRFIRLDWADAALRVRSGAADIGELDQILTEAHAGLEAKKKTRTVLNRLWLEPREEVVGLADRGVDIFARVSNAQVEVLTWGMAIAVYPFFAKVAEIIGRLTAIQGDCTTTEVHRRMAEVYGEREGTRRMTNMVIQSQIDWGVLAKCQNGRTLTRKPAISLQSPETVQWLTLALLLRSKRPLSLDGIAAEPAVFPFSFGENLGFVISTFDALDMRGDSAGNRIISLVGSNG